MHALLLVAALAMPSSAGPREDFLALQQRAQAQLQQTQARARSSEPCADAAEHDALREKMRATTFLSPENNAATAEFRALRNRLLAKGAETMAAINGLDVASAALVANQLGEVEYALTLSDDTRCLISGHLVRVMARGEWVYPVYTGSCVSPGLEARELVALQPRCE